MAKYIITSIPQYKDGGPGKRKKKKTVEPQGTTYDNPQLREMISKSLGADEWLAKFKSDNESKLNSVKQSMIDMYARNIEEERQKEREKERNTFTDKYNKYIEGTLKKGDKYKKGLLAPFQSFTKEEFENNSKLQNDYNNKSSNIYQAYHVEKKDLGNGDYKINLYPKQAIRNLMWHYGVKPGEFQTHHGLDAEQLQKEFGDELKAVDQYHIGQGADMIDKLTKQGYSAEDAKRILVKKGYNAAEGVTQFKDIADAYDIKNNADTYFVDDNLVMYKKDKTGKVYKYTNSYGNDNFSVNDPSKYQESDNPLKDTKNWIWESVDPSKVKTNKEGNITVNGRSANLYDYGFGDRPGDKNDKAILSKYTTAVGSMYKESEEAAAVGSQQETYNYYNNTMYDNVYENNPDQKLSTIPAIGSGLNDEYVTAYNNTVAEINKTTDVNKKAKLLEDFNSKMNKSIKVYKPGSKETYDKKVNMGSFDNYGEAFNNRDVKAYKTASGLKNQMNYAKDEAAQNILQYAYTNKINPGSENLNYVGYDGSKYTGEEGDQTLPFEIWSQTPEAQEFITNYKKDPKYAEKIYDVEKNRAEKKWQDYQNENSLWKKPTLSNFLEKAGQQISSLTNQPVYTLNQWASGNEIDPMIGLMNDAPTPTNINNWGATLGPGGSELFLDKHAALNKDLSTQIVNLFNPAHFANQAGMGLRNLYEGDPDQGVGDVALNAAFAALPASKFLRGVSAAKLLPGAKYVGKLANNRLYNATRNLITPGAGLTGMFVKDAFLPTGEIDPNTGEEIQGFGVEAGKNIWNEIEKAKEKSKISNSLPESSSPFSSLDYLAHLDSDKVKENLFDLGIAGMIGLHGGKTALGFGKDLYRGVPNRLPANTRLLNNRYNFKLDPAQFNEQYYRSKLDPKEPLRLRKEGGDLPQAKMGWPPKGLRSRRTTSTVFGKPTYKPSSTYFNKGIKTGETFSSIKKLPTSNVDIKYPIQFGNEPYKLQGEPTYHVDPLDYQGLDWQKQGIIDYLYNETREPTTTFPELEKNVNNVEGSDISIDLNKLGDFKFKPWSKGWEVRNQMMNAFDGSQKTLSKSDFWTDADLNKSIDLGKQFDEHHDEFMDFLSVDDIPGFIQKYPHLSEIFSNEFKFPKSKFYSNQTQRKLINDVQGFGFSMIDPLGTGALSALAKGKPFPKTVSEYYTSKPSVLGKPDIKFDSVLPSDQIFNKPFKGRDAWNQITSQPGWKNKNGGVSVQLSKKEIDKYIQGGYIVEEE